MAKDPTATGLPPELQPLAEKLATRFGIRGGGHQTRADLIAQANAQFDAAAYGWLVQHYGRPQKLGPSATVTWDPEPWAIHRALSYLDAHPELRRNYVAEAIKPAPITSGGKRPVLPGAFLPDPNVVAAWSPDLQDDDSPAVPAAIQAGGTGAPTQRGTRGVPQAL